CESVKLCHMKFDDTYLSGDKKSELLPTGWNGTITVDSTLIFNLMDSTTEQVSDLTVNVSDYVDAEHLQAFERLVNTQILCRRQAMMTCSCRREGNSCFAPHTSWTTSCLRNARRIHT
uniref:Uncharacterized protein n=1 Tax=Salmo trutta TaxID=8032 RepID=A0A674AZQ5_SALTR